MANPLWCETPARPRIEQALATARAGEPVPLLALLCEFLHGLDLDTLDSLTPEALRVLAEHAPALPAAWHPYALAVAIRWCGDRAAVARFLDAAVAEPGAWETCRPIVTASRARLAFARDLAARGLDQVPVLSLGLECMAFDLGLRFGFGVRQGGRLLVSPFSLAVHRPDLMLRVLETGWDDYAPADALQVLRSAQGMPIIARRDGHVVWNHHLGEAWAADGFAPFLANIAGLQACFDRALDGAGGRLAAFVVCANSVIDPAHHPAWLERVLQALDARFPAARPHLLAIHTPREPGPLAAAADGLRIGPRIAALEMPVPRGDYVWWDDLQNSAPAGLAHESRIAAWMAAKLATWRDAA